MAIRKLELAGMPIFEALQKYKGQQGKLDWYVSHYQGKTSIGWTLTERRTTRVGMFKTNQSLVNAANARLQQIAKEFNDYVVNTSLCTEDRCRQDDRMAEMNEGSAYSEYEQSIGSEIKFLDDGIFKAPAPTPAPAPKPVTPTPVGPVVTPTKPTEPKHRTTPYVDSIPGITPETKRHFILAPFVEQIHKLFPDIAWTGTLWPAEKTRAMVTAEVTPEQIKQIRRGKSGRLKWYASSYKGRAMGHKWWMAEFSFPGVDIPEEDDNYRYRVVLAVPTNQMSSSIALRVVAYKKG